MKNIFLFIAVFFTFLGCQLGEKALFRINLNKGDKFTYITETKQTIIQTVNKKSMQIEQTVHNEFEYVVEDIDAQTNINFRIVFKNLTIDMTVDGVAMKMSSDTNGLAGDLATQVSSKLLSAMIGKPFNVTVNHSGEVVSVKNLDTLFNEMFASMTNLGSVAEVGQQMSQSINQMVSPDTIKEMMRQNFNAYPVQPLGVGDSWESAIVIKTGFPMDIQMKNKIEKMDKKTAEILLDATLKTTSDAALIDLGGVKAGFEIKSGVQKGSYVVDVATGMTLSANIDLDFNGVIKISGAQSQEIPMSISGKTLLKMK